MKELLKRIYIKQIKYTYFWRTLGVHQKKNTVLFITTFHDNNISIKKQLSANIYEVLEFNPNDTSMKKQLKLIKQADIIIVDNYYYPLAALKFPQKKIVQIWHAAGAVKKFGLAAPKNQKMSKSAKRRFRAVYNSFDYIAVGSEAMKECMKEAFETEEDGKFLTTGFVRSDYLYTHEYEMSVKNLMLHNRNLTEKFVILYMPTFRDNKVDNEKQLDFVKKLAQELPDEFSVFYRLHPGVEIKDYEIPEAIEVCDYQLNEFYKVSDLIITDYSSVIFDAAIFNTACAFYVYDYEKYEEEQGLFIPKEELPGFVTTDSEEMIDYIQTKNYNRDKIEAFNQKWNEYNGASSGRKLVIELLHKKEK